MVSGKTWEFNLTSLNFQIKYIHMNDGDLSLVIAVNDFNKMQIIKFDSLQIVTIYVFR
jgi:hypothetical protein